jgi:peptidoglycan hydrolase CwlO-like protein
MEDFKNQLNKKFLPIYVLSIIFLIIFFGMIFNTYIAYDDVKYLKKEIEKSEVIIQQAYKKNQEIENKILEYQKVINNIDKQIGDNNDKIDKLKKDEKNQTNKFKSYDARMWEKYFTDRYKGK